MNQSSNRESGLWDLAVLCLLYERPMHPYEMQRTLVERKKDLVLGLKKGSLYHAINRLERRDLIKAKETSRDGRRPEKTTYELTEAGQSDLFTRLKSHISTPKWEPNDFMASLSFLVFLPVADATAALETRQTQLTTEIAELAHTLVAAKPHAGRINLLELEYMHAMKTAEQKWVAEVLADVRDGRLVWDIEPILQILRAQVKS